ncbi:MAG TPA: hypothetical protein VIZ69_08355, partial [Thermoanaerobaculia bacterium]
MSESPFAGEAEWRSAASAAITKLARSGESFTAADVIAAVGPPPLASQLATLFRAAHLAGLIEKDPGAQVGTVWVGKTPLREPLERKGPGRRKDDQFKIPDEIWNEAHLRAKSEGV